VAASWQPGAATASAIEFVGISARSCGGRAPLELRRAHPAAFARLRTLGRVPPHLGPQLHQVGEDIRLAAEFVGGHRRLAGDAGNYGNADATALHSLDQRTEIAVARKQDHLVDLPGELHRMDRDLDVHVAEDLAAPGGVDVFLGRLGDDGIAIVVEPVDQRPDRGKFLILDDGGIVEGAEQRAAALEFVQEPLVVDVEPKRLGRGVKVGSIDEERNPG
jgi:hypothetical protein